MHDQVSPEQWDLPRDGDGYDVRLCAVILGRVAEALPWLEPDEHMSVARLATGAIGRITTAWETGFIPDIDSTLYFSGYEVRVSLPDLSSYKSETQYE